MARLLIVHHTPPPATAELFDAVVNGACHPDVTGVEVVRRAAPAATATDLPAADDARNACSEVPPVLAAAIMDDAG